MLSMMPRNSLAMGAVSPCDNPDTRKNRENSVKVVLLAIVRSYASLLNPVYSSQVLQRRTSFDTLHSTSYETRECTILLLIHMRVLTLPQENQFIMS